MFELFNFLGNLALVVGLFYGIYKIPWLVGKTAKGIVNAFKE